MIRLVQEIDGKPPTVWSAADIGGERDDPATTMAALLMKLPTRPMSMAELRRPAIPCIVRFEVSQDVRDALMDASRSRLLDSESKPIGTYRGVDVVVMDC